MLKKNNIKSAITAIALAVSALPAFASDGYPLPGRIEGDKAMISESDVAPRVNLEYPSWMKGKSKDGLADKHATYAERALLGPQSMVNEGFVNEHIYATTIELKPGAIFPAYTHESNELFFVVDGTAQWTVNDETQIVVPGSYVYARPDSARGWKNISDETLKVIMMRWDNKGEDNLEDAIRFVNKDLIKKAKTASIAAQPMPAPVQAKADAVAKNGIAPRFIEETSFIHDGMLTKYSTSSHPTWVRGTGPGRLSDENSRYFYRAAISPWPTAPEFKNDRVFVGLANWSANTTYPSHNHPAPEFYYVISGEGEFSSNDLLMDIKKGDFMYTRPFDAHGWKVTSEEPLVVLSVWFIEEDDNVMNVNAKFINHEASQKEETARHYPMPLPKVRARVE